MVRVASAAFTTSLQPKINTGGNVTLRHMVFSSTCATYGDQGGWCLMSKALNACGASKKAVEENHTGARADTKNSFL